MNRNTAFPWISGAASGCWLDKRRSRSAFCYSFFKGLPVRAGRVTVPAFFGASA